MSAEPNMGILGFIGAANEIAAERGCSFSEALDIWKQSVTPADEPELETNVIYGVDFANKVRP